MSSKSYARTNLAGVDFSNRTKKSLESEFSKILNKGIHGISFSVYLDDQQPGSQISAEQIITRMQVIKPFVKCMRSFSCTDGNEQIPRIAHA